MNRTLPLVMLAALAAVAAPRAQAPALDLIGLIDTYAQGRYDEAVAKAAAIPDLGPLRLRFVQDTPAWIAADPARSEARSAAVAAFLLELTATRLESDWGRFGDLIEWTCISLRKSGPPTEFERAWHRASHALAGRGRVRQWLLGEFAVLPHQKPSKAPPSNPQRPPPRHLMHALERFPEDPHFQLSRIVAWTWGRDGEPIRNLRPRDNDRPTMIRRRPAQLEAVTALEPLTAIEEVAGEAFVRIGVMQFVVREYEAALRANERAQEVAREPAMKFIAFLNAGRALEALERPVDAMRAYEQALTIVPDAESATVALTSLQFMRDERDAAVATIDRVFNRLPSPTDPGRLIGYGSYFRWPDLKSALRSSLPK